MKLWNHYHTPKSVDEALGILNQYDGNARIIAGGTDLLIDLKAEANGHIQEALVDVTRISELSQITVDSEYIYIGAAVTHNQIVQSRGIADFATSLVESCGVVGGPQVRNVGTIGGNVAHALPAGDGTTSLVALGAEAEIILNGERKWIPILDMYVGPGQSLLNSTRDLLIRLRLKPSKNGQGSAFKRIMRPQGVALPILGCSVWVELNEDKTHYSNARICVAPVAKTPILVQEAQQALIGQPANDATIQQAVQIAYDTLKPRTSKYRATAEYRKEMIAVLLQHTLPLATQRASTGEAIPEGIGGV